ncbi:hypothetical protein Pan216_50340 [Planctomycetes bacterium Pan216]|uniref:DUF1570 domain-containing protein n=1 Tax=Kolteria novifilia TaxID=2527975 RepID=A0A518BAY5_9BACT|nr:hypothetical protein Pan216_50340 [Planctomycetes bacterium Pan216]
MTPTSRSAAILATLYSITIFSLSQADTITFSQDGLRKTVEGNVLAEDSRGGLLVEGRDGQHHILQSGDVLERQRSAEEVQPYSNRDLQRALEEELGPQFKFLKTNNYLVCYSGDQAYARQAATLFERAYSTFTNYFRRRGGFRFEKPKFPLIAIVCASRSEYIDLVSKELGPLAAQTAGVYMPGTNRMYMYDATGGQTGQNLQRIAQTNARQAQNFAFLLQEQNISTVIHEAVHQIAFNTGFHKRHVLNPLWLVEGMAMYFEAPDRDARGGWRGAGKVNRERLERFSKMYPSGLIPLEQMIIDDTVFRQADTANDAYAQAWALSYFLAKSKTKSYIKYLKILYEREPMVEYTPEERLADFRTAFGKSPEKLEVDFKRYMKRVVLK